MISQLYMFNSPIIKFTTNPKIIIRDILKPTVSRIKDKISIRSILLRLYKVAKNPEQMLSTLKKILKI